MVELLVVIGIIALIVAILLPVVIAARTQAKIIECQSNARQLNMAIIAYSSVYCAFPPNFSGTSSGPQQWYDIDRVRKFFPVVPTDGSADIRGRAVACPEDLDSVRSYAMNCWASSRLTDSIVKSGTGQLWRPWSRPASQLILLAECWSSGGTAKFGWAAPVMMGYYGDTPGRRFGGGTGILPMVSTVRYGLLNCELPYARHRSRKGPGQGLQPIGRVTIAYADGHVAMKSESDLYNPVTGLSRLDSLWSPKDYELNH